MGIKVESLHPHDTLNRFHEIFNFCTETGSRVTDMESLGKTFGSYIKFFDLSFMPRLPSFFQKLASQNKVCLDVIGAYKIVFCISKVSECDEVGRNYWETHKATEIVDIGCTTISYFIGTVKFIAYLASVVLSPTLNLWKMGLTSLAFSCRGYNDFYAVRKLDSSLATIIRRREHSNNKTRETSEQILLNRYELAREEHGKELARQKILLKVLCEDKPFSDLNAVRATAADYLEKIKKLDLKLQRVEKYLFALEFESVDRFIELKKLKWDNRVENCRNNLINKTYSRDFHSSFAVSLAFSMLTTLFAVQSIVILTSVSVVSVAASTIGLSWLVNKPVKKTYEII